MGFVSEKLWRRFSTKGMWIDVIGHPLVSRAVEARAEYAGESGRNRKTLAEGILHDQRYGKDHGCMRS
jgi:hypothetical protein